MKLVTFLIRQLVLLFLFIVFIIGCSEVIKPETSSSPIVLLPHIEKFVYSPDSSLYKVTFPSKPEISVDYPVGNTGVKDEICELKIESDTSVLRAEIILHNISALTLEKQKQIIEKYSFSTGLSNASISTFKTEVGDCLKLKGFKILHPEEKGGIAITYVGEFYFNKNSIFVLFVGCPSKSYPSKSISNFLNSIAFK